MDRPLFIYGALCDAELCAAVLGRHPDRRNILVAVAPGFRVVIYPQQAGAALVRAPGGRAEGLLVLGLKGFERGVIDAVEAPLYRREIVPVMIDEELHEADAYLPVLAIGADAPAWSLASWQAHHKPQALAAAGAEAAALRARLMAARPN